MKIFSGFLLTACLCLFTSGRLAAWNESYEALQKHFERVVDERFALAFKGIDNVRDWEKERAGIKAKLLKMLGQDRAWPGQPPAVKITRHIERRDYIVECLVLETAPGLYATANLYLPRTGAGAYPLIIYQCGHSPQEYYGNKTAFKHHGVWFAAHGIACLILDTIEMGELQVTHHGVYSNHWYDWYSRGYSPLAAELYNARRAMDYLVTRPEIDGSRIGATGISGGGVTTFFLTLLDDRIKAAAPVSGVCSLVGQVHDRLPVEHCDCMYPVNSYGLLYSEMGALAAPRPFLLCNARSDGLFPMPWFEQLVEKMRVIYRLCGASDSLKTALVPGGHADSEAIRLPVYAFFLKEFLGQDTTLTEQGPVDTLNMTELTCYTDGFPLDEHLTRIHTEFMPRAFTGADPGGAAGKAARLSELTAKLQPEVFGYFPRAAAPFEARWEDKPSRWGRSLRQVSFNSFSDLRVSGIYSLPARRDPGKKLPAVIVLQDERRAAPWGGRTSAEGYDWGGRAVLVVETVDMGLRAIDDSLEHQMWREAMIAGRSFDGMRVYEILRAVAFLRGLPEVDPARITIVGRGAMGVNGLYAALLDQTVERAVLESPPASHVAGPYYLGILTLTDIPEVAGLLADRVRLFGAVPVEISETLKRFAPDKEIRRASLAECLE